MKETTNNEIISEITIGDSIKSNNITLINIMVSLVVFSAVVFAIFGYFARCIKGLAESSEGIAQARNYQSEWVSDAIYAITTGEDMNSEIDADKCAFAQWKSEYKGYRIKNNNAV